MGILRWSTPSPATSGDVPDEVEARLCPFWGRSIPHTAKMDDSNAGKEVQEILDQRGNSPRIYKNSLVFLAPDATRLGELDQAVRQYLAWKSINEERVELNLDAFQENQAKTKLQQADDTVKQRMPETYLWLLVPGQSDPQSEPEWQETRAPRTGLAGRSGIQETSPGRTVIYSNGWRSASSGTGPCSSLARGSCLDQPVGRRLREVSLPGARLQNSELLAKSIEDGLALLTWEPDSFAYAEGFDEATGRYQGLRAGQQVSVTIFGQGLVRHDRILERSPPL